MKNICLLLIFIAIPLNAQCYKGVSATKEQKLQLKNICNKYCKVYNSIKLDYENKVKNLKIKASEEHYNLNQIYNKKRDSLEYFLNKETADVLNDTQKVLFWEQIKIKKNKRRDGVPF